MTISERLGQPVIELTTQQVDHQDSEQSRFSELCDIIANVAAIALALSISPIVFMVGIGGSIVSGVRAISRFVNWVGQQQPGWKEDYYYPFMGEVLSGAALVTTLFCGTRLVAVAAKVAVIPAIFCTLTGYYAPANLYHKVYPWPDRIAAKALELMSF